VTDQGDWHPEHSKLAAAAGIISALSIVAMLALTYTMNQPEPPWVVFWLLLTVVWILALMVLNARRSRRGRRRRHARPTR